MLIRPSKKYSGGSGRGGFSPGLRLRALLLFAVLIIGIAMVSPGYFKFGRQADPPVIVVESVISGEQGDEVEEGEVRVDLRPVAPWLNPDEEPEAPEPTVDPEPFVLVPSILEQVVDRTDYLDAQAVAYLFQRVRSDPSWSNEGEVASVREATAVWKKWIDAPEKHRGQQILLEGILVALDRGQSPFQLAGLPRDNPSGVRRYYTAFLYTGETFFRIGAWRLPEETIEDRATVRVRGMFLQLYENDILHDGVVKKAWVPVLVADSFTPVRRPSSPGAFGFLGPSSVVLLGLFAIVLVVSLWAFSRGDRRYEEKLREVRERLGVKPRERKPRVSGAGDPADSMSRPSKG